ncbi:hypothetical protein NMY22_g16677 [Coprinellus aureogranulatus]|nr:hypothetical protein NMY22_g16677 [Coprinellus aureogranulatus]
MEESGLSAICGKETLKWTCSSSSALARLWLKALLGDYLASELRSVPALDASPSSRYSVGEAAPFKAPREVGTSATPTSILSTITMFIHITDVLSVVFFATMSAASVIQVARTEPTPPPNTPCGTDPVQCCNSVQDAGSPIAIALLSLLGIPAGSFTGQVGLTCSPISIIGLPDNSCSTQPVCCANNSFNGIVALDCTEININL